MSVVMDARLHLERQLTKINRTKRSSGCVTIVALLFLSPGLVGIMMAANLPRGTPESGFAAMAFYPLLLYLPVMAIATIVLAISFVVWLVAAARADRIASEVRSRGE